MKNQAYRMSLLLDFYGDLLTERQRDLFDLYYNDDLSLTEIAENFGITRQGARDVIVRAETIMTDLEDKIHIIRRYQHSVEALDAIDRLADELHAAAEGRQYNDAMLESVSRALKEQTAILREVQ